MPLFGPNIKKMKERREVDKIVFELLNNKNQEIRIEALMALIELQYTKGLILALGSGYQELHDKAIQALRNNINELADALKDAQSNIRIEAAEALKEIGAPDGIKRLADYCNNTLKFGDLEHKIEAITIIRGRGYSTFLSPEFKYKEERARQLENLQRKLPLELVKSALLSMAIDENEAAFIRWYASIALTELGYINDEVLKVLIYTSEYFIARHYTPDEDSFTLFLFARWMQEETLRALSYFKGNPIASEAIINALQGRFLAGGYRDQLPVREALYALGALGNPNSRDVLEYWANYAQDETTRAYAKKALKYFGKASYDEIEKA